MRSALSKIIHSLLFSVTAICAASCSLIYEDREGCPEGLYVRFVYDYNTLRADIFKDHVGYVTLFIYDENGKLTAQRTVSNDSENAPLSQYGYTMHFSPKELPAGHSYRLQAVAMQRHPDNPLASTGAKYRLSSTSPENSESLTVSLDHDNEPAPGTMQYAVDSSAPLDTLWHTLKVIPHEPVGGLAVPAPDRTSAPFSIYPVEEQWVKVKADHATYATVSLIRDTKHLNITIRQVDSPENISADDYEVKIIDNNAHLSHDNGVLTHDSVRYTPYASWTSRVFETDGFRGEPGETQTIQHAAHFNMMFNRLMINTEDQDDNAILEVHNRNNGALVARVNLPYILAQGRQAFAIQNYGLQEYLDREHDYRLDFFLKGDEWILIEIHVLSWSKRIQNFELD